jgi:hypothetical protein
MSVLPSSFLQSFMLRILLHTREVGLIACLVGTENLLQHCKLNLCYSFSSLSYHMKARPEVLTHLQDHVEESAVFFAETLHTCRRQFSECIRTERVDYTPRVTQPRVTSLYFFSQPCTCTARFKLNLTQEFPLIVTFDLPVKSILYLKNSLNSCNNISCTKDITVRIKTPLLDFISSVA